MAISFLYALDTEADHLVAAGLLGIIKCGIGFCQHIFQRTPGTGFPVG